MDGPDTISLFAGAGGLEHLVDGRTLGIESWPAVCATRKAAGLATLEADVRDTGPADFPTAKHLRGGPPCQTFSVTGNGKGRKALDAVKTAAWLLAARAPIMSQVAALDDERTGLVLEPLRWTLAAIDRGRPYETIVLEQVRQALPVWEVFARILRREGYGVETGVLKAEQFGVPQTRRRAVLIARHGRPAQLPQPTHNAYQPGMPQHYATLSIMKPWVSMGDALPHRGPFTAVSNYGTGGDPRNRGRRTSAEPAFTVTGKVNRTRLVDADGNDLPRFTPAEAGALQGFPLDHPWSGRDVWQQIGNCVPRQLAAAILTRVHADY
jgi:DNA (cytosine-5)-methyltransferase 1